MTLRGNIADRVRQATDHELEEQTRLRRTDDFKEGVKAVAERAHPISKVIERHAHLHFWSCEIAVIPPLVVARGRMVSRPSTAVAEIVVRTMRRA